MSGATSSDTQVPVFSEPEDAVTVVDNGGAFAKDSALSCQVLSETERTAKPTEELL